MTFHTNIIDAPGLLSPDGGGKTKIIKYIPVPTAKKFHASNAFARAIMGPLGSGKSVACVCEIISRGMQQRVGRDGIRNSKWGVIRNTYGELEHTTLQTWKEWVPESIYTLRMSKPITCTIDKLPLADGTFMSLFVIFVSLDKPRDIRKLLSLELTGAWINEAREINKPFLDQLTGRLGRFPAKKMDGLNWRGLIMDSNPPDKDSWWYRLFEEKRPDDWVLWKQPPALLCEDKQWRANPAAENVENQNLGYAYWFQMLAGKDRDWLTAYVEGKYASTFTGKPVYKDHWNEGMHLSMKPLPVYRGLPLILGWDFGLTPACIVGQLIPNGPLNILREYWWKDGALRQFVENVVKPQLQRNFDGMRFLSYADPAGKQRSQDEGTTCIDLLDKMGYPTIAQVTNDFTMRRDSVIDFLSRMAGGKPAFQLDPSCAMLQQGFNGGYQFKRVQVTGEERYVDIPNKNDYSHPHDALQAICLMANKPMLADEPKTKPAVIVRTGGWAGAV